MFPGGGGDYYAKGQYVLDQIKKFNDAGHFYPLWATCLGFEHLVTYTADKGKNVIDEFDVFGESLPLAFTKSPIDSRMYHDMGKDAFELSKGNFTYNHHKWGVAPSQFLSDKGLNSFWDVTANSFTSNGTEFVASIEAKKYPIYGTQFHPEKPTELWSEVTGDYINHSWESL